MKNEKIMQNYNENRKKIYNNKIVTNEKIRYILKKTKILHEYYDPFGKLIIGK